MAIINCKDKRSGITYVYESESYWDKEKQQPRSHRRLIGKLDEATGEIVPTGKRGRKKNSNHSDVTSEIQIIKTEEYQERLKEKDETIRLLRRQIQELKKERKALGEKLAAIAAGLKG